MTIYDLKLYGAYFPRLAGVAKVTLADLPGGVLEKAPREYRFEVELLKQYGSKRDVLELQYPDGRKEHVTLYEPTMYLEDGEWYLSENNDVAEAFLAMYELLQEKETVDSAGSIFDYTFYGLLDKEFKAKVSLFKVARDREFTEGDMLFTAVVLKKYKGKDYVVKCVREGGEATYIPLFQSNIYYDIIRMRWNNCSENPIPGEILKCYIKYLNG
ncbi:MAG: hypothetical protein IJ272_06695 [Clostridia bacterium]|nr:hypothetical protein [Clostridia bacterium]